MNFVKDMDIIAITGHLSAMVNQDKAQEPRFMDEEPVLFSLD